MKRLAAVLLLFASCSKSAKNTIPKTPHIIFTFADKKRPSGLTDTLHDGRFFAVTGGNNPGIDTTHGYVFSLTGPNGSNLSLSIEIPRIASGTYAYSAYSPSWPMPLALDQWVNWDNTYLDPVEASITIEFARYSAGTVDGTFSLHMEAGTYYVTVSNGSFTDVPVTN